MTPKKRRKSSRTYYLISDFTPSEIREITAYCKRKGISISKFLSELAISEVRRASKEPRKQEQITITVTVSAEELAKIKMFAHRQDTTMDAFLKGLVTPTVAKAKTSFTSETRSLRYYLSPDDHKLILDFLKERNLSARTYISYLALEALRRDKAQKRRKSK